jgi:TrfA protein
MLSREKQTESTSSLLTRVKDIEVRALAQSAAQRQQLPPAPQQLPIWQDDLRGFPNGIARTSLFTAAKHDSGSQKREFYEKPKQLASLSNITINYRGQELRQDDASVFMTLLHLARNTSLGEPVRFTAYSMLKELGWSVNSQEYRHLRECCERLQFTSLKISTNDETGGYSGSLIADFQWKDAQGEKLDQWFITLVPTIAKLFAPDNYTLYDWEIRRRIGGRAPLAQWLHYFLGTHSKPYPMSIPKYYELSGSRARDLADFRRRFKQALQKLVDVGFLCEYRVANDIVSVVREPVRHPAPLLATPAPEQQELLTSA